MLKIGMIGPDFLLRYNYMIFQQQQIAAIPIYTEKQLKQIDGLVITGWKKSDFLWHLQQLRPIIEQQAQQISLLGIAAGATALGKKGFFSAMDCNVSLKAGRQLTTAILEMPGYTTDRFTACFLPDVRFYNLAPNLGVLCQDQKRGPIVIRQGNNLACAFVAELTPQPYLYSYWLEMVAALKNSRRI